MLLGRSGCRGGAMLLGGGECGSRDERGENERLGEVHDRRNSGSITIDTK